MGTRGAKGSQGRRQQLEQPGREIRVCEKRGDHVGDREGHGSGSGNMKEYGFRDWKGDAYEDRNPGK